MMRRCGSLLKHHTRALILTLSVLLSGPVGVALAQPASPPPPGIEARNGFILLSAENTVALEVGNRRLARVTFPETAEAVLGPDRTGPGHQLLRRLVAAGRAAGNGGDLYENRDRGHSRLPAKAHPQLTHVIYDDALRAQDLDYGLGLTMLFDAPLIGNSSTAQTGGPLWRSQPRLALTIPGGPQRLYRNYVSGQIHVYPEHRDHDPERGDLLPANTPYMLISQGSSGSDRAHLEALAMILAAFRPDTKVFLKEAGLIASTVQMVYRRARVGVRSRAAYLSGGAHPTAFRASDIDLVRMVGLANAILSGEVPPMVRLQVLEETEAQEGADYFGEGLSERLFDTPSAVARIWRSRAGRRSMVVSAADTADPNGRALRFDWVLLRGDPERVRITPLTPDGRYAQIEIAWQDARPTPGAPDILSARVDIGVFANNGIHDSAPAFVSVLLPRHEARDYVAGPGDTLRVLGIDRGLNVTAYADPLLFPATPWEDRYVYDRQGKLTGWLRVRPDGVTRYDARGARIRKDDGTAAPVRYPVGRERNGLLRLSEIMQAR